MLHIIIKLYVLFITIFIIIFYVLFMQPINNLTTQILNNQLSNNNAVNYSMQSSFINLNSSISNSNRFLNIRFLEKISYGTEFLNEFKTSITRTRSGIETRNALQNQSRRIYNIYLNKLKMEEITELYSFFEIVKGSLHSFRFKDITNYKAINQPLANQEQGNIFRFAKTNAILDKNNNIIYQTKYITKIVEDSVVIYNNNKIVDKSLYKIDYINGILECVNQNNINFDNLRADFEFDIHVRLDNDAISIKYNSKGFEHGHNIRLIEVNDGFS